MKTRNLLLTAFALLGLMMVAGPALQAQTCDGSGSNYIDLNGDGFNDNAPDEDGDGIPNGLDEDYIKHAQDGDGYKHQKGKASEGTDASLSKSGSALEGDASKGADAVMAQNKFMAMYQKMYKLQAFNGYLFQYQIKALGTPVASGTGVCDGSGGNMNGNGTGDCDGTGPKGNQNKGGK